MRDDGLYKIGDIAKLFHISISLIRHYENIGLVVPEYIDKETGYRYYSSRQFEYFNIIGYLRTLDFSLNDISDFLKNRDVEVIKEKLYAQRERVEEKKKEIERIERKIDSRLALIESAENARLDAIELIDAPSINMISIERNIEIKDAMDMEEPTSMLAKLQAEPVIFLGKVGLSISIGNLLAGRLEGYTGIFLIIDKEDKATTDIITLPASKAIRLRFNGRHTEAAEQYERMLSYINSNGYEIAGESREIALIDHGITRDESKFVTEITIPVKKLQK